MDDADGVVPRKYLSMAPVHYTFTSILPNFRVLWNEKYLNCPIVPIDTQDYQERRNHARKRFKLSSYACKIGVAVLTRQAAQLVAPIMYLNYKQIM